MTVTDESVDVKVETDEDTTGASNEDSDNDDENSDGPGRKKDRDFTKFRESHKELAEYINANSGLDPITPNHVKAILALRSDFAETPEQVKKREERKAKAAEIAKKYEGLTPEQIKERKAAEKLDKEAARLEERLAEARAKAEALRAGKEATGADLAAAVESGQNGKVASDEEATGETAPSKPRIGGRKR